MSNGISLEITTREQECSKCKKTISENQIVFYVFKNRNTQSSLSAYYCSSDCLASHKMACKKKCKSSSSGIKIENGDTYYRIPVASGALLLTEEEGDFYVSMSEEEKITLCIKYGNPFTKLRSILFIDDEDAKKVLLAKQEKEKARKDLYMNPDLSDPLKYFQKKKLKWTFFGDWGTLHIGRDLWCQENRLGDIVFCIGSSFKMARARERKLAQSNIKELIQDKVEALNILSHMYCREFRDIWESCDEFVSDFINKNKLFWEVDSSEWEQQDYGFKKEELGVLAISPNPIERMLSKRVWNKYNKKEA